LSDEFLPCGFEVDIVLVDAAEHQFIGAILVDAALVLPTVPPLDDELLANQPSHPLLHNDILCVVEQLLHVSLLLVHHVLLHPQPEHFQRLLTQSVHHIAANDVEHFLQIRETEVAFNVSVFDHFGDVHLDILQELQGFGK